MKSKTNPRWEAAPLEEGFIMAPGVERWFKNPYPRRAETVADYKAGKWVPPFLTEQPDGSWVESWGEPVPSLKVC